MVRSIHKDWCLNIYYQVINFGTRIVYLILDYMLHLNLNKRHNYEKTNYY